MTVSKASIGATLTDGSGVSAITSSKAIKDFVADFLMTAAAGTVAVNILGIQDAAAAPAVATASILNALIKAGYRAVLKWATSD